MNVAIIMGRMVRDVELRQLQDGTAVCEFTIAVNRQYNRDKADFIGCKAFRQTAEFIAKYFHKGDMIAVKGSIEVDEWTDKEDKKQHKTKINVENVEFAGGKKETTTATADTNAFGAFDTADTKESNLPFDWE